MYTVALKQQDITTIIYVTTTTIIFEITERTHQFYYNNLKKQPITNYL